MASRQALAFIVNWRKCSSVLAFPSHSAAESTVFWQVKLWLFICLCCLFSLDGMADRGERRQKRHVQQQKTVNLLLSNFANLLASKWNICIRDVVAVVMKKQWKRERDVDWASVLGYDRRRCGRLEKENALSDCWPTATAVNRTRSQHREWDLLCDTQTVHCFCPLLLTLCTSIRSPITCVQLLCLTAQTASSRFGYKSMLNCWLRSNLYHFGPHGKL